MDAESQQAREVPTTLIQVVAYEETIRILNDQIARRNQLIAELCDALKIHSVREPVIEDLIQRAREATR